MNRPRGYFDPSKGFYLSAGYYQLVSDDVLALEALDAVTASVAAAGRTDSNRLFASYAAGDAFVSSVAAAGRTDVLLVRETYTAADAMTASVAVGGVHEEV